MLSRTTIDDVQLGIDNRAMAEAQQKDAKVQAYHTATSSLKLEDVPFGKQGVMLFCDTFTSNPRSVVPVDWRHQVFT